MIRLCFIVLCMLAFGSNTLQAQKGHDIRIEIADYPADSLMIGYHFGATQYIQDTLIATKKATFRLKGDELLEPGVYLLILWPDQHYLELLVDKNQRFSVKFDRKNPVETARFKASDENEAFYNYLRYLNKKRKQIKQLEAQIAATDSTQVEITAQLDQQIGAIKSEIVNHQKELVGRYPGSLLAQLIGANMRPELPEFEGTEEEINIKTWEYYRKHFFDRYSINDRRLLRSPILLPRLESYLTKFTVQHPDSIIVAADMLLGQITDPEIFKYALSSMLNRYAKSDIVGMDAVFVHLVDKYYAKGRAPWMKEENLVKLVKSADRLRPILLGKTAPDIRVFRRDKSPVQLSEIEADYTILFFWSPKCSHCQKSIPGLKSFYNKFKSKGIEILAVCTKTGDAEKSCWDFVDQQGMDIWINTSDPKLSSRFPLLYDVRSTPQVFILDKDKKILMKRIATSRLEEIMTILMAREAGQK